MATVKRRKLRSDQRGTAMLEFSIVAGTMMTVLFGIVEFSNLFSQWNAATKAVQAGARLAATSDPLWPELTNLTGDENGDDPGETLTNYTFRVVCTTSGCAGPDTIAGNQPKNYDSTALNNLVYGRGSATCGDPPGTYFGMCDIYPRIRPENIRITYEHTGAGYATRPGGIVPTITVEIIGLNFQFVFLDNIMALFNEQNLRTIPIPGLLTTMIAEDMRSGAPTF